MTLQITMRNNEMMNFTEVHHTLRKGLKFIIFQKKNKIELDMINILETKFI